ncbi:MAG: RNA-binding protein [Nanoarchaeota archaeon]|nr:RNA-binding protein [Nanoarchaeota archaeon]
MSDKVLCDSCDTDVSVVDNNVIFKCPGCNKVNIVRCGNCRQKAVKYVCPKCCFEGP